MSELKYFEGELLVLWIDLASHRDNQVSSDRLDSRVYSRKTSFSGGLDIPLQFCKGNFVKVLEFAVLLTLLLHCVIGQMH